MADTAIFANQGQYMGHSSLQLVLTRPVPPISESDQGPPLPKKDNEPGSVEQLLRANRWWRAHPWPEPFNRTVHTVRYADARELTHVDNNSVHLIVTSPPYFNIKAYESEAGGTVSLGGSPSMKLFCSSSAAAWRNGSVFLFQVAG